MAEVLSQNEIDALLAAVSVGDIDTEEKTQSGDWIAYDLTSQERIIRGRFAALTSIHERFARALRVSLSNTFRKNVIVTCTNMEFVKFTDYITSMLAPISFNLYSMRGLNGTLIFVAGTKLTYALVDAYYGGPERPFSKTGTHETFTKIETKMIRKVSDIAAKNLCEAWRPNHPLTLDYVRTESNPHFVGAIHVSDLVAVVSFEIEFENLSGPLTAVIQLKALDPIQEALKVDHSEDGPQGVNEWRRHWLTELAELPLDLRVELGLAQRTLTEIQAFKPGDVIVLDQNTVSPLPIYISELEKAAGIMGTFRGSRAVRITELSVPGDERA